MEDMQNNICSYCERVILDKNKAITCGYCGKIYHKNCFIESNGCNDLDCKGSSKKLVNQSLLAQKAKEIEYEFSQTLEEENSLCPNCGSLNLKDAIYCSKCGYEFKKHTYQKTKLEDKNSVFNMDNSINDFEIAYIKRNVLYYKSSFEKMRTQNTSNSWNWAAALFSPAWFFYRKMYKLGLGLFVLLNVLQLILGENILPILLAFAFIMGLKGNAIYMSYIEKQEKASSQMSELEKLNHANKVGGVSLISVVLVSLISFILTALIIRIL